MSVKMMGLVWDMNLPRAEKFVLLAYADHADHNGRNIFPSQDTIAKKTGYGRRQINSITQALSKPRDAEGDIPARDAILVEDGVSRYSTIKWRMDIQACAKIAHVGVEGVQNPQVGVQKEAESDAEIAHEPSLEPSNKTIKELIQLQQPEAVELWEQVKGILYTEQYLQNTGAWNLYIETVTPICRQNGTVLLAVPPENIPLMNSNYKGTLDRRSSVSFEFISNQEAL